MNSVTNASKVRAEFSGWFDSVVRERPQAVQRHRDTIFAFAVSHVEEMIKDKRFKLVDKQVEDDGSLTASLHEIDLVANAPDLKSLKHDLAEQLIDYAKEYEEEFPLYFNAPNRRAHFPYVVRVWLCSNVEEVEELID
ncbi:hypothetical protein ACFQ49_01910 [Kroppenstedtia eburnea]|nr:hypothetical protein [Kroppenstedtia eburnea]QKI82800.1 hypothetical protein GXN75_12795 [Kroppenstedtia eburnea]